MESRQRKIPFMVQASKLPENFTDQVLSVAGYVGVSNAAIIRPKHRSIRQPHWVDSLDWLLVPTCLTDELSNLPWEHVLGQGMLIQGAKGITAMMTIAEAATLQLEGIVELLECLLIAIDTSLRRDPKGEDIQTFRLDWRYKLYLPCSVEMCCARTMSGQMALGIWKVSDQTEMLCMEVMTLLEWIQAVLEPPISRKNPENQGLSTRNAPTRFEAVRRQSRQIHLSDKLSLSHEITVEGLYLAGVPPEADFQPLGGCWCRKITSGMVLKAIHSEKSSLPIPLSKAEENSLVLTARALWSLFDFELHPMPSCKCTLQAGPDEFLRCKKRNSGWFFWHYEKDGAKLCRGQKCDMGVAITYGGNDGLHPESPCVVGWEAKTREAPMDSIANTIGVSNSFLKKEAVSYTPASFLFQGQLGFSGPVNAQAVMGTTFNMKRYKVTHSMPYDSMLAAALSEIAIVLIYCEQRQIHLAVHGADLIESICVKILAELLDPTIPQFVHKCALERMQTWRSSTFVTRSGSIVSGEELVKYACKRILQFIDKSREHKKTLYWTLREMLAGANCIGLDMPSSAKQTGWYNLSKRHPILVVAVGRIHDKLLSDTGEFPTLAWDNSKRSLKGLVIDSLKWRSPLSPAGPGGILADNNLIKSLLKQAREIYPATLKKSNKKINVGPKSHECFEILEEDESLVTQQVVKCRTCDVWSTGWPDKICLHYFF